MLSPCRAQMKVSFPGLKFVQYKSINIIVLLLLLLLLLLLFYLPHNNTKRFTNNRG